MLLIPGIIASSGAPQVGDFESISTVTVGAGGVSSVNFTNIATSWKHLQLRILMRTEAASTTSTLRIQLGNTTVDAGTNYSFHNLFGNGTAATSTAGATQSGMNLGLVAGDNAAANIFGVSVVDILDYASTNKNTTVRALTGEDQNGSGTIYLSGGQWMNTAAVNYIRCRPSVAGDMKEGTVISLYGIKG